MHKLVRQGFTFTAPIYAVPSLCITLNVIQYNPLSTVVHVKTRCLKCNERVPCYITIRAMPFQSVYFLRSLFDGKVKTIFSTQCTLWIESHRAIDEGSFSMAVTRRNRPMNDFVGNSCHLLSSTAHNSGDEDCQHGHLVVWQSKKTGMVLSCPLPSGTPDARNVALLFFSAALC